MRSIFQNKYWTLLLAVLALGALTVLSISLGDVSFKEAQPIGRKEATPVEFQFQNPVPGAQNISLKSLILFWVMITLLVALIAILMSPEARKRFIRIFLRILTTFWLLYYIMKNYGEQIASLFNFNPPPGVENQQNPNLLNAPPPVFVPPHPSPWIIYLVTIVVILLAVYLGWRTLAYWRQVLSFRGVERPLKEIAKIARSSLNELKDGIDSTDVIMNCYFRMSRVVAEKRRLSRLDSVTPAEFASQLEQAGLPGDAVQRLTRLFEAVRYGGMRSGPKDVNEAVACLTSILNYCGETV